MFFASLIVFISLFDLLLSRNDIELNLKDNYGQTALSMSATNGHESIVRRLLARDDIDSNPTDKAGRTPLSLAAQHGRESIVKLLLAHSNNNPNQGPASIVHNGLAVAAYFRRYQTQIRIFDRVLRWGCMNTLAVTDDTFLEDTYPVESDYEARNEVFSQYLM